ncbi:MAG: phosphate acyltransferase [Paracoccus sp. (in: a-proteobacteria)]|uniref:phosphate acyltransferase n=1 Tax=Paracoccus sp. TaxID=267 RepID=UPI0026E0D8F4|nr:phosphate acyltransferase [Paracoccus sp. (in: a-proteobacteria)]MDO5630208.1 phosphate acyltransferase [Paracoccus sp. (in: a-proteobacteria)]
MVIRSFDALRAALMGRAPLSVAVAGGEDDATLAALATAHGAGIVGDVTLTGDAERIRAALPPALAGATIIDAPTDAAPRAVAAIRAGRAGVLVKGRVDSAAYLRAVVDRDTGLRGPGVLSNLTLAEMPSVPRLIGATDNGILPLPTLDQKRAIIHNALPLFRGLGLSAPRIAAIAASEKISDSQPATTDAAALARAAAVGEFGTALVDGPFGYDVALSPTAAARKGLGESPVAGQADLILFPSIESGNATVKAWKLHGQARTASIVLGARVPVLLNSRSDGADARLLGLLLAGAVLSQSTGDDR